MNVPLSTCAVAAGQQCISPPLIFSETCSWLLVSSVAGAACPEMRSAALDPGTGHLMVCGPPRNTSRHSIILLVYPRPTKDVVENNVPIRTTHCKLSACIKEFTLCLLTVCHISVTRAGHCHAGGSSSHVVSFHPVNSKYWAGIKTLVLQHNIIDRRESDTLRNTRHCSRRHSKDYFTTIWI